MGSQSTILMLGIGGMGMSALARYYLEEGNTVIGYDRVKSQNTNYLESLGAVISFEENPSDFLKDYQEINLCVYTPAIAEDNLFLSYARQKRMKSLKRADALSEILKGKNVIAVAGTHGKTTTASILSSIFLKSDKKFTCFLGGWAYDFEGNYYSSGKDYFIVEADEFDRSFLKLEPSMAIVTSMDADHLDIYGTKGQLEASFNEFIHKVKDGGSVFSPLYLSLNPSASLNYFNLGSKNSYRLTNIMITAGSYYFDLQGPDFSMERISSVLPGNHNIENSLAAAALAHQCGIAEENIRNGIQEFKGIFRRFKIHINTEALTYIDDYAHHPTEIAAISKACRQMFPDRKLIAVFQPHLFSRTRDFLEEFASELSTFDQVCLLPIYPAREKAIEGVSSEALLNKISIREKALFQKEDFVEEFVPGKNSVLITMGAGDIDSLVEPLTSKLKRLW